MEIIYSKQAVKFLNKLNANTKLRITNAINRLPFGDVKKLKNLPYYRLRVGDFRVIFNKAMQIITIMKIDNRGEVYKR